LEWNLFYSENLATRYSHLRWAVIILLEILLGLILNGGFVKKNFVILFTCEEWKNINR
jgi:hypothetical protein